MQTKSILIVDDAVIIAERLLDMLQQEVQHCTVHIANTINEAKLYLFHTVPEIMILDVNLNDGSGLHFLEYLKNTYPSVKVIMFTNNMHPAYKTLSLNLGASYFLDKSNDFDKLPAVITSLMPTVPGGVSVIRQ